MASLSVGHMGTHCLYTFQALFSLVIPGPLSQPGDGTVHWGSATGTLWRSGEDPYHEHTEGPPVGTLRVSPPVHHLGRHVLDRPAERVSSLVVVNGLLTQPEI